MHTVAAYTLPSEEQCALAERLVAALGTEYPDWTVDDEVRDLRNADGLPQTRCVLDASGTVIGSASLLTTDEVSDYDHVSPWLGDLYVMPEHRHAGIGTHLVHAVMDEARTRGFTALHLVTNTAVDWYQSLGWHHLNTVEVHGHAMTLMCVEL